jgi:hypothetical protein
VGDGRWDDSLRHDERSLGWEHVERGLWIGERRKMEYEIDEIVV